LLYRFLQKYIVVSLFKKKHERFHMAEYYKNNSFCKNTQFHRNSHFLHTLMFFLKNTNFCNKIRFCDICYKNCCFDRLANRPRRGALSQRFFAYKLPIRNKKTLAMRSRHKTLVRPKTRQKKYFFLDHFFYF
jgi:hypothetical protein